MIIVLWTHSSDRDDVDVGDDKWLEVDIIDNFLMDPSSDSDDVDVGDDKWLEVDIMC